MYSVPGGNKLDASFDADDNLEVELLRRQSTYSYKDGDAFVFLDDEDYTPYTLDADVIGDDAGYITDGLTGIYVQVIDEQPVAIQLPASVVLEVIETPPELVARHQAPEAGQAQHRHRDHGAGVHRQRRARAGEHRHREFACRSPIAACGKFAAGSKQRITDSR